MVSPLPCIPPIPNSLSPQTQNTDTHTLLYTHTSFSYPPSDSWKQNSSDSFCCFSLSLELPSPTSPNTPTMTSHHPLSPSLTLSVSLPLCRNRICRNHSKARYNLLLAVHNAPPTPPPLLNRTRCPADELIILEILFLLLIPPFYEQLRFYGARD